MNLYEVHAWSPYRHPRKTGTMREYLVQAVDALSASAAISRLHPGCQIRRCSQVLAPTAMLLRSWHTED